MAWRNESLFKCSSGSVKLTYTSSLPIKTGKPLYKRVPYKTVLDIKHFYGKPPKSVLSKEKCIDYVEK